MVELAVKMWGGVPPVSRKTSPGLAAVLGLLFGAIGLAIYFRAVVDFLVPLLLYFISTFFIGDFLAGDPFFGGVFGMIIAGAYGYFRSAESNLRLETAAAAS